MDRFDLEQHAAVFLQAAKLLRSHAEKNASFSYRDLGTLAIACALIAQAYKDEAEKLKR